MATFGGTPAGAAPVVAARMGDADFAAGWTTAPGSSRDARLTAQTRPHAAGGLGIARDAGTGGVAARSRGGWHAAPHPEPGGHRHLKTGSLRDVMAGGLILHAPPANAICAGGGGQPPQRGAARPVLDNLIDWTAREP